MHAFVKKKIFIHAFVDIRRNEKEKVTKGIHSLFCCYVGNFLYNFYFFVNNIICSFKVFNQVKKKKNSIELDSTTYYFFLKKG